MELPKLALGIPNFGPFYPLGRLHEIVDTARRAEEAGVDSLIVVDHVVMSAHTERYTWGPFPYPDLSTPWLEPLTALAAIAGATRRVRLATGILIAPLRPAAVLAKTVATLDVLSQGRVDLGVGTGWQKEEFEACQMDYNRRGQLLTDTVAACRALWGPSPAHFESPTMRFRDIWCDPKPVQKPLPIWFSGTLHKTNLERLTRLGDGWIPIMGESNPGVAEGTRRIQEAWSAAGRDPARLRVRGALELRMKDKRRPDLRATLEGMHEQAAAGATEATLQLLGFAQSPEQLPDFFAELGETWSKIKSSGA
jgi:probable F420-dependent oxidoreductase